MNSCGCQYFEAETCRSCGLLGISYAEQLKSKQLAVQSAMDRVGIAVSVLPCVESDSTFNSRNKAKMVVGGTIDRPLFGIVGEGYSIKDLSACPLILPCLREVVQALPNLVRAHKIEPYDINKRKGEFKYCIARASATTGELQIRFVLRSKTQFSEISELVAVLHKQFPKLLVSSINLQPIHQAVLEGNEEILLSKNEFIHDRLGGLIFCLSPQSFWQVTSNVAFKLYQHAAQQIELWRPKLLLDLFCGVGAFSLFSAKYCERVTGIEIGESSIADARRSAKLNQITNVDFVTGDVETLIASYEQRPEVLVVNPPRRGLGVQLVNEVLQVAPKYIFYSSCNSDSLARDLILLLPTYKLKSLTPFDMFPLTEHVEIAAVLVRS